MLSSFSINQKRVPCNGLDEKEIVEAYLAISCDHPELYQLPTDPKITQSVGLMGRNMELVIQNLYDKPQRRKIDAQIKQVKTQLLSSVSPYASAYEKEKIVCDYILEHTTYEVNNRSNQNVASVIVNHKAQCSGIARAVKLMLGWFGIDSIVVHGEATSNSGQRGPHDWNVVWIDSKCYHLDVTFMLGSNVNNRKPFRYLYLNYTDDEISSGRYWDKDKIPRCNSVWEQDRQTSSNGVVEGGAPTLTISSLYEFKQQLKAAILSNERSFSFISQIAVNEGELMKYISNACKMVTDALAKHVTITISIVGNQVGISW